MQIYDPLNDDYEEPVQSPYNRDVKTDIQVILPVTDWPVGVAKIQSRPKAYLNDRRGKQDSIPFPIVYHKPREMMPGIGPVAVEACCGVRGTAGPFRFLEECVHYYEGRMADIVKGREKDLKSVGLWQEDGIIRMRPEADLSEGTPQRKMLDDVLLDVAVDLEQHLCWVDQDNDPITGLPGYHGFVNGIGRTMEPADDGKALTPMLFLERWPECDLKYMLAAGVGVAAVPGVQMRYYEDGKMVMSSEGMRPRYSSMDRLNDRLAAMDQEGPSARQAEYGM